VFSVELKRTSTLIFNLVKKNAHVMLGKNVRQGTVPGGFAPLKRKTVNQRREDLDVKNAAEAWLWDRELCHGRRRVSSKLLPPMRGTD
jgi:hypothetical protein